MHYHKHVGFEIRTASNLIKRRVDNLIANKDIGNVTGIHVWIIDYIYKNIDKDIFQKDIEEQFSIRRSTATTVLQLMEKNNLITRTSVDYDARLKKIMLTEKAISISKNIRKYLSEFEEQLIEGLSKEELDNFFSVLEKLKANL